MKTGTLLVGFTLAAVVNTFSQPIEVSPGTTEPVRRTPGMVTQRAVVSSAELARQATLPAAVLPEARRYVEGELLVKFRGGPRGPAGESVRARIGHAVKRDFDFIGWQQIRLPAAMTVEQALVHYKQLPEVLAVEPNALVRSVDRAEAPLPNDPQFGQQWSLAKIGATNAWAFATGSTDVVAVVTDSGVNYNHEDLRDNMWHNPGEIPGNGIDDDGNGFVDDVYGIDAIDNDGDPFPISGNYHGTAVAGIIGAIGNNRKGLAGVNWTVRIMAIRLLLANELIPLADRLQAFDYILLMKSRGVNIRVTNMSWGDNVFYQSFADAVAAVGNAGILQVAATLNPIVDVDVTPDYPGNHQLPSVIVVADSDENDMLRSAYGRTNVDLAAPGVAVPLAWGPGNGSYSNFSGTSFAAPLVAGSVALLAAVNPAASAEDIKAALLETVDVLPAFTNKMVSNGRLNLGRAVYHPRIGAIAPPFIVGQPQAQTGLESNSATFAVNALGSLPLNYQWRSYGVALTDGTNATLRVNALVSQQPGDYTVVVSNAYGAVTSAVATLTVLKPPRLIQPSPALGLSAVLGEMVTLSVETTGTLPIGYRWRQIRTNGSSVNLTNFVLNQNTCYFTFAAGTNSGGAYTVIFTNAAQRSSSIQRTNAVLTMLADSDEDGLPDVWETAFPTATNPDEDTDHDGLTNLQEYQAGTDPTDAPGYLKVDSVSLINAGNAARLTFFAISNKSYTVESCTAVDTGGWMRVGDVLAVATNRVVEVIDSSSPSTNAHRYYRLVTPRTP